MSRHEKVVGTVRCRTDEQTMSSIAQAGGLLVRREQEADLYHLLNSGRGIEHEVGTELFAALGARLDEAVRGGLIPSWSPVSPGAKTH